MSNNSQGKKQEVEDHRRKFKFSNNKTFVTACNESLNAKTLNVNVVPVLRCGKSCADMKIMISLDHSVHRRLWCSKHMTGNRKLLTTFVEKFAGNGDVLEMIKLHQFLWLWRSVSRTITIKRGYYGRRAYSQFILRSSNSCDEIWKLLFRWENLDKIRKRSRKGPSDPGPTKFNNGTEEWTIYVPVHKVKKMFLRSALAETSSAVHAADNPDKRQQHNTTHTSTTTDVADPPH
ncbi:hypothetical protein Tco_0567528 [Tanacetum coccineum]